MLRGFTPYPEQLQTLEDMLFKYSQQIWPAADAEHDGETPPEGFQETLSQVVNLMIQEREPAAVRMQMVNEFTNFAMEMGAQHSDKKPLLQLLHSSLEIISALYLGQVPSLTFTSTKDFIDSEVKTDKSLRGPIARGSSYLDASKTGGRIVTEVSLDYSSGISVGVEARRQDNRVSAASGHRL